MTYFGGKKMYIVQINTHRQTAGKPIDHICGFKRYFLTRSLLRENHSNARRERASTYTDGGMLWWLPPTFATLVLKVDQSNSRHAHHAQLRFTCILGKNILPSRTMRVWWLYAATVDFALWENTPQKMTRWGGKIRAIKGQRC